MFFFFHQTPSKTDSIAALNIIILVFRGVNSTKGITIFSILSGTASTRPTSLMQHTSPPATLSIIVLIFWGANKVIVLSLASASASISNLLVTATTNIIALSLRGVNLSPPSSMIERCFRTRYLAAIAIESEFEEPNQDLYSPVQSCSRATKIPVSPIDVFSIDSFDHLSITSAESARIFRKAADPHLIPTAARGNTIFAYIQRCTLVLIATISRFLGWFRFLLLKDLFFET